MQAHYLKKQTQDASKKQAKEKRKRRDKQRNTARDALDATVRAAFEQYSPNEGSELPPDPFAVALYAKEVPDAILVDFLRDWCGKTIEEMKTIFH